MQFKNQKELFDYVWQTREHISELTQEPLLPQGHFMWHWQFLHILPKGTFPHYKLNPDNIILALPTEHDHQEQYEEFNKRKDKLRREYYERYYNKEYK